MDGNAYERLAIEAWFATGRITSPLTNARLGSRALTPNLTLKRAVSDFLATNGVHLADAHRQANEVLTNFLKLAQLALNCLHMLLFCYQR